MNDYIGKLTKNEMSEIETGMLISLGLDSYLAAAKEKERAATTVPAAPEAPAEKTDIAVGGGFQRPRRPRIHYGVCAA